MGMNKTVIGRFLACSSNTRKEVLIMILMIVKARLLVMYFPLRFYFDHYFSNKETFIPDKQLLFQKVGLFRSVKKALPFKLTCLVESMALFDILHRHGIVNPVHLGIRIDDNLNAHAWNDHQQVSKFKAII